MERFYRSNTDRKIMGICGGLGKLMEVDPLILRLVFVGLVFTPFPIIVLYLITGLITESIEWGD
jgi:phage shock protein PspC (stress-responsive transcriptional regulator)